MRRPLLALLLLPAAAVAALGATDPPDAAAPDDEVPRAVLPDPGAQAPPTPEAPSAAAEEFGYDPTLLPPTLEQDDPPGIFPSIEMLTGIPPAPTWPVQGPPIELAGNAEDKLQWETTLNERELALERAQQTVLTEMERLRELEKKVERRWVEARQARQYAEQACGTSVLTGAELTAALELTEEDRALRMQSVVGILKKMKPVKAADLLQTWDDSLAIRALEQVGSRSAVAILSKMPTDVAGRLTRRMATGQVAFPAGVPR